MNIAILDFEGAIKSSVSGIDYMLRKCCDIYSFASGQMLENTWTTEVVHESTVESNHTAYDMVLIPSMEFELVGDVLARSGPMVAWLTRQHAHGAEVAATCLGAFLLAETGLLDGKRATTHWLGAQQFKALYPKVQLETDKIIIDEGGLYSCGGALTYTSLMMYLIEKFLGEEVATVVSKVYMINRHDVPQSAFAIFSLQHHHNDEEVRQAQHYLEAHFAERIRMETLAEACNLSERSLIRRFEQATGNTPLEYLQRVRVEAAKRLFEKGNEGVEQAALKIGYDDLGFFRKVFKRHVGISPKEYRDRYARLKRMAVAA